MRWLRKPVPAWVVLIFAVSTAVATSSLFVVIDQNVADRAAQPDFAMTASPILASIFAGGAPGVWGTPPPGNPWSSAIDIRATNYFTGIVSMTVSAPSTLDARLYTDDGCHCSPVGQVLLGVNQRLTLDIRASSAGNYSLSVTGTSGRLSHSVTVSVIVRGLAFSANPSPVSVSPGSSANTTVTLTSQNGFGGPLTLGYVTNNIGLSASGPQSTVIAPGGTATITITVNLSPGRIGGPVSVGVGTPLGGTSFGFLVVAASPG